MRRGIQPRRQQVLQLQHLQQDGGGADQARHHHRPHEGLGKLGAPARLHPQLHPGRQQNHSQQIGHRDEEEADVSLRQPADPLRERDQQPAATQQAQGVETELGFLRRQTKTADQAKQAQTKKGRQIGVQPGGHWIDIGHAGPGKQDDQAEDKSPVAMVVFEHVHSRRFKNEQFNPH